jgi:CRP/FNR family transcriptional regulator, cyclic AMP receptor protein
MKRLLQRLKGAGPADPPGMPSTFATTLMPEDEAVLPWVDWAVRAAQVGARPLDAGAAAAKWLALWHDDRHVAALPDGAAARLAPRLHAAEVPAGQTLVAQDEQGNFLLVLLQGRVAVERAGAGASGEPRPSRRRTDDPSRLSEARPGDLLGELALFDAGPRFASCRTLQPCEVAVLDAGGLQRLMADDAPLAAALMAAMARRLSLRLRLTSARLNALLSPP